MTEILPLGLGDINEVLSLVIHASFLFKERERVEEKLPLPGQDPLS